MEKRPLGNSNLSITPLMLGGNVFGWTADEPTSFAVLDAFVAQGGNSIDTADAYSSWVPGHEGGESETVIGKWLKKSGKRNQVVIGTKVGLWGKRPGLKRQNIIDACHDSLRRLGVDTIDLYWLHKDDGETPIDEFLGALDELVKVGKVRTVGASNFKVPRFAAATLRLQYSSSIVPSSCSTRAEQLSTQSPQLQYKMPLISVISARWMCPQTTDCTACFSASWATARSKLLTY